MGERNQARADYPRSELRLMAGFRAADEIAKLYGLNASRSISNRGYVLLRGKLQEQQASTRSDGDL